MRKTVVIGVSFDPELLRQIDAIRGRVARSRWISDVCRAAVQAYQEAED